MRVAFVLVPWAINQIMAQLDLTCAEGLFYATMWAFGYFFFGRGAEVYFADKEDVDLSSFDDGMNFSFAFSKGSMEKSVVRGCRHRPGCSKKGECANDGKWCLPCMFKKYFQLTGSTGIMWPAFSGNGAFTQKSMTDALREVRARLYIACLATPVVCTT
jgi:hypothetical protein